MNRNTKEVMAMFNCSAETAEKIIAKMEESGLDFSECTNAEFRRAARGAAQVVLFNAKPSTNFKRKGKLPKTAAVLARKEREATQARNVGAVRVDGNRVGVQNAGGVEFTLTCDGPLHAELIAKALSDGLVDIDSRPEE